MKSQDLHIKHRPKNLGDILGQDSILDSIENLIKNKKLPHALLFHGQSGVGKTTIARAIANELGCGASNIIEMDAATNTGVDDIRLLQDRVLYTSFGENKLKFVIIDEAHMLTKNAWNSFLKLLEEPPSHVYFVLCTTELSKVPKTIKTRCHSYLLSAVSNDCLEALINYVANEEDIVISPEFVNIIIDASEGSARQSLVYLSMCRDCSDIEELEQLVHGFSTDNPDVLDLCKILIKSSGSFNANNWQKTAVLLKQIKKTVPNIEAARIQCMGYFTACLLNSKDTNSIEKFSHMVEAFGHPMMHNTGKNDFIYACYRVIF